MKSEPLYITLRKGINIRDSISFDKHINSQKIRDFIHEQISGRFLNRRTNRLNATVRVVVMVRQGKQSKPKSI